MDVHRGEVYRTVVPLPARPGPGPPEPTNKRVAVLRTSGDREADVPCVLLSTDHQPADPPRAAYVVKVAANDDWGTEVPSKIDCRWVFTLAKENLNPAIGMLPDPTMDEIDVALVIGLQLT